MEFVLPSKYNKIPKNKMEDCYENKHILEQIIGIHLVGIQIYDDEVCAISWGYLHYFSRAVTPVRAISMINSRPISSRKVSILRVAPATCRM